MKPKSVTLEEALDIYSKNFLDRKMTQQEYLGTIGTLYNRVAKGICLPEECYKYPSGVQQVSTESTEKWILEKLEITKSGEIFVHVKDSMFPYKNFANADQVYNANMVKALFIEITKVISKWYFIPALLLADKQNLIDSFNRIAFKICGANILKYKHLSKFSKALHFVIFTMLVEMKLSEESADRFAEIFAFIIDLDNAYRLRLEDIFSASSKEKLIKNPYKEVDRLIKLVVKRDINPAVSRKFKSVANILKYALLIKTVKNAFVKTIKDSEYKDLCFDEADEYWVVIRTDYNFMGMTVEERKEFAKGRGYIYSNPISE